MIVVTTVFSVIFLTITTIATPFKMCKSNNETINSFLDEIEHSSSRLNSSQSSFKTHKNHEHQNRTPQSLLECDNYCDGCGPGREYGYSSSFIDSCRNWEGYGFLYSGGTSIPYWINWPTMNTITNETNRNTLINDIRYQASLWNLTKMHDGSGNLMNFYEVCVGQNNRPFLYDSKPVIEICRQDGEYAGQFNPSLLKININYDSSGIGVRPGRNIDTPMHEMGHVLGLWDLDAGTTFGTHHVLMGYNRGTEESTLFDAIKYSDIQGVALLNGVHTNHRYNRYLIHDGLYKHVCFYCDTIEATSSPLSGSQLFIDSSSCEHEYEDMVSIGDKYWIKCTKCYKVLEHYHSFDYSYENYNNSSHLAYCWCGKSRLSPHIFNDHYCVYCNCYTFDHDYHSPYTWLNLQKHLATCSCGETNQQPHYVSSGGGININYNGHNYMTCLLCGGDADIGFVNPFNIGDLNRGESYVFPNGVIMISSEDVTSFLTNKRI